MTVGFASRGVFLMLMSFICWVICLICKQFRVEERVDEWALGAEYVASLPSSPKATDTSKAMQIDSAPVDQAEGQGVAESMIAYDCSEIVETTAKNLSVKNSCGQS